MTRLAAHLVRWWPAVIILWLLAAVGLSVLAPAFEDVATFDDTAFLGEEAPAIRGRQLLTQGWPDDDFARTAAVVLAREDDTLQAGDEAYARALIGWLRSERSPAALGDVTTHLHEPALSDVFVAQDGQAMFLLVGLEAPPFTPPANEAIAALREHVAASRTPVGLDVEVTGSGAVAADEAAAIDRSVSRTHLITLVLVTVILLWVYRSPVAPLVPLITIGVAFVVSLSTVSLLAQAGMQVASLYETFSIVIVFGAGTDYCLFLLSRYHEELGLATRRGYVPSRRLRSGTLTATVLVLAMVLGSSAMTTVAGFSAQAVARFGLYRTMGPAMALAVIITLAAALTLTPALMRLFGRHLFWPDRSGSSHSTGAARLLIEQRAGDLDLDLERTEPAPGARR